MQAIKRELRKLDRTALDLAIEAAVPIDRIQGWIVDCVNLPPADERAVLAALRRWRRERTAKREGGA